MAFSNPAGISTGGSLKAGELPGWGLRNAETSTETLCKIRGWSVKDRIAGGCRRGASRHCPHAQPTKNTAKEVGEEARDLPHPNPLPKERENRRSCQVGSTQLTLLLPLASFISLRGQCEEAPASRCRERFCLPTEKGGRRLFPMRRKTSMGVLHCNSHVAGSAVQFNSSVSAMPDKHTRTFAAPPHPGTADTLLLR